MCGLFGHTIGQAPFQPDISRRALNTLTHRGPDQWDDWHDDHVYTGHRRLSILDLSEAGKQPMYNDKAVMTANGEIWNFQDLRAELEGSHEFGSLSDSEVLLHGYTEWGIEGLVDRIDGMFVFTIYDRETHTLHIVRDRYGIKPLYYAPACELTNGRFLYASEAKALLEFEPKLRAFSRSGIADWLMHRGSWSGTTIYDGILTLMPGHRVQIDTTTGKHDIFQYYDILDAVAGEETKPQDFDLHFDAAIRRRLISDVPAGLQLSGGVDSSLVAESMARQSNKSDIKSFSIGFSEAAERHMSEEPFARKAAGQLGLVHHQKNISKKDVAEAYEHVLWLADGMLDYPNTIPIYLLSKYSKDHVTVQLTGEGADELFGGYTKFKRMAGLARSPFFLRLVPEWAIKMAAKLKPELGRRLYLHKHYGRQKEDILNHLNGYISRRSVVAITQSTPEKLLDQVFPENSEARRKFDALPFEKQLLVLDHKTYLRAVLERQDKASMGASIESRVPFLDKALVHFALCLPVQDLFGTKETKKLLKEKTAGLFGRDFAYRRKVGFPLPIESWMEDEQGFKPFFDKIYEDDFLLKDMVSPRLMSESRFDRVLLHYGDPESRWIKWFLMVLRGAQDAFDIKEVRP